MSLITRCPACGTMFKVVTDQLKVSQGWVRCGHCSEVFDASLNLQQAAPEPVVPLYQEPAPPPAFTASPRGFSSRSEVQINDTSWAPGVFVEADQNLSVRPPVDHDPRAASDDVVPSLFDPADWKQQHSHAMDESSSLPLTQYAEAVRAERTATAAVIAEASAPAPVPHAASISDEEVLSEFPLATPDVADDVSFVREARRRAIWQKPAVRMVLGFVSLLLVALLGAQIVLQQRDSLAAAEPKLRPWLDAFCERVGCRIAPVRRIETVVIDSSSFNKLDADSYRLGFSIKNTGGVPVAMPSLEVTLTDTQDQALMRRVLAPAQLGASGAPLAAGSDFTGAVVMQVLGFDSVGNGSGQSVSQRVAGYRILAFYP